jgi:hypothetical protein
MIPGILTYVYIGTLVGDLAGISSGAGKGAPGKWAEVIGLIATIAVDRLRYPRRSKSSAGT